MSGNKTALKKPPVFANPETMPESMIGKDLRTAANVNALAPYPNPTIKKSKITNEKGGTPLNKRKHDQPIKTDYMNNHIRSFNHV